jgi:hypothetical protein
METHSDNKSPITLDESEKNTHCFQIHKLLKYKYKLMNMPDRNLIIPEPSNETINIYTKLFDTYYTHCEYKSKIQK